MSKFRELMETVYSDTYYKGHKRVGWKQGYNERALGKPHTELHRLIDKFFPNKPSMLVLGCALGLAVKRGLQCGHYAVGIDWTPAIGKMHLVRNLVRGSVTSLPFKDKSFELGINVNLMEHIPAEMGRQVILEQGRVCKQHLFSIPCFIDFKQLGSFFKESGHITFKTKEEWIKALSILGPVQMWHKQNPYGWRFFIVR